MLTPQSILISESDIRYRVGEMGIQIANDYKKQELFLLCVLGGAVLFYADLARAIYRVHCQESAQPGIKSVGSVSLRFEFVQLSSYRNKTEPSAVELIHGGSDSLTNKHVLIVEDIVDKGRTLAFLLAHLKTLNLKTVKVCTLLNKPYARKVPVNIDYCGFDIPDVFVVGYGLDYAGKYRNFPYVAVLGETSEKQTGESLVYPGKGSAE